MFGFIYLTDEKLVYTGGNTGDLYNQGDIKSLSKETELFTIKIFDDLIEYNLPIAKVGEDITNKFISFLTELSKNRAISDRKYRVWQEILKNFNIIKSEDGIGFRKKDIVKKNITNNEKGNYILAKEFLDGYYSFESYKGVGAVQAHPVGREYPVKLGDNDGKVVGSFAPTLREIMFGDTEFKRTTGKLMQDRQYDVIKYMGHITLFTMDRRGGKSYLLSFAVVREITKQRRSEKPIKVIFISISDVALEDVRDYINNMCNKFEGVYDYNKKDKTVSFYIVGQDGTKTLNGYVKFITAGGYEPGIGKFADLIIFDEANKISEQVLNNILPIVTKEGAKLLCASTLYGDSARDHWFYEMLNEAEKETFKRGDIDLYIKNTWKELNLFEDIANVDLKKMGDKVKKDLRLVGLRFTGDDNQLISNDEKKLDRDISMKRNPDDYFARYRGIYADEPKAINYELCIGEMETGYEYVVISYDPAKHFDGAAVIVSGYKKGKIYDFEEHLLEGDYKAQLPALGKIRDNLKRYNEKVFMAIDRTGVGQGLFDLAPLCGIVFELGVGITGGSGVKHIDLGQYTVGKEYLVELTQTLIEDQNVVFSRSLSHTFEEFKLYKKRMTNGSVATYQAHSGHDDFVSANLVKNFFIYDFMGNKHDMLKGAIDRFSPKPTEQEITKRKEDLDNQKKETKEQEVIDNTRSQLYSNYIL